MVALSRHKRDFHGLMHLPPAPQTNAGSHPPDITENTGVATADAKPWRLLACSQEGVGGNFWVVKRSVAHVCSPCHTHTSQLPGLCSREYQGTQLVPRVKAFTSVGIPSCSTNSRLSICTLGKAILSISYKTFSHKYRDKCNSIQYMVQFSKNAKIDRLASQWDVRRINIDSGVFDIINLGVVTYVFHSIMCHFLAPEKYLPWQVHPSSTTSPLLCCIHFSMLAIHSSNIVNNQF